MLSTGIPELEHAEDIAYLRQSLSLSMSEEEATQYFTDLIWKSLNTKATNLNFFVHNVAHRKKKQ